MKRDRIIEAGEQILGIKIHRAGDQPISVLIRSYIPTLNLSVKYVLSCQLFKMRDVFSFCSVVNVFTNLVSLMRRSV